MKTSLYFAPQKFTIPLYIKANILRRTTDADIFYRRRHNIIAEFAEFNFSPKPITKEKSSTRLIKNKRDRRTIC